MVDQSLPFAMALLDLGQESGQEDTYSQELKTLNQIYRDNPDLGKLLSAPTVSKQEKLEVLNTLFAGDLSETMQHFLQILVQHRMAGKIPEIFDDYTKLYNKAHGIERVKVTSASPLEDAQAQALKAMLEKKLGKTIELSLAVDPALIAGLRIETESRTLDNSYAARLSSMKEQLQKG